MLCCDQNRTYVPMLVFPYSPDELFQVYFPTRQLIGAFLQTWLSCLLQKSKASHTDSASPLISPLSRCILSVLTQVCFTSVRSQPITSKGQSSFHHSLKSNPDRTPGTVIEILRQTSAESAIQSRPLLSTKFAW